MGVLGLAGGTSAGIHDDLADAGTDRVCGHHMAAGRLVVDADLFQQQELQPLEAWLLTAGDNGSCNSR